MSFILVRLLWGAYHVVLLHHRHGGVRGIGLPDPGSEGTGGSLHRGSATSKVTGLWGLVGGLRRSLGISACLPTSPVMDSERTPSNLSQSVQSGTQVYPAIGN